MNWVVVARPRPQPTTGNYASWKPEIARACRGQCVYCTITEGEYGGLDNFHVEHFRPKSRFVHLENDINNLFIACAICNRFKSDDWPGDPDDAGATATYLDPSEVDYHNHIRRKGAGVVLKGTTVACQYCVERLFLNRPQLLVSRRLRLVLERLTKVNAALEAELPAVAAAGVNGKAIILKIAPVSLALNTLQAKIATARPYVAGETQRSEMDGP